MKEQKTSRAVGHLFIISGPSGTGKTTLCSLVLSRMQDLLYSVSYTTRKPRRGEQDGIDYFFIEKTDFKRKIQNGRWAEWAKVHDNFYGTCADFIDKGLKSGHDILLDIDVQGTVQILKNYPESVTIFIMPPSLDILKKRLESRKTDSEGEIEQRLVNAANEIAQKNIYRHIIYNVNLSTTVVELTSLIEKYRHVPRLSNP
ncbi:MAG: guanylate kinase [Desulfobacterales bacterium]|nr:guanylate kinase [Desulfobacterales bacterium]